MAQITLGDSDFYYELHGQGQPLVLIAGFGCDHTFWEGMVPELAQHFQILVFDNRGIGQSTLTGEISIDKMADDTIALMKALKLNNVYLLGQSMGGAIAQVVAKKIPYDINKLIILNSVSIFSTIARLAIENSINLLKQNVPLDLVIDCCLPWFYSSHFLNDQQNIVAIKAAIKQNPYPPSIANQEKYFQAICNFNSQAWAHEIVAPTLVLVAKEDIICTPMESLLLAKKISKAQVIALLGGHSTPVESPLEANKAILPFLLEDLPSYKALSY